MPFDYQIMLLGGQDVCVWTTCPELSPDSETARTWICNFLTVSPLSELLWHEASHTVLMWGMLLSV